MRAKYKYLWEWYNLGFFLSFFFDDFYMNSTQNAIITERRQRIQCVWLMFISALSGLGILKNVQIENKNSSACENYPDRKWG